jgi:hypothetical protein
VVDRAPSAAELKAGDHCLHRSARGKGFDRQEIQTQRGAWSAA